MESISIKHEGFSVYPNPNPKTLKARASVLMISNTTVRLARRAGSEVCILRIIVLCAMQAGAAEARRSEELAALASRFQSVLSNREARAQALQEELAAAKAQLAMHTALLQQQHDQLLLTV